MPSLSTANFRAYLSQSISSLNLNKVRGMMAEVDFRHHLNAVGFGDRVSPGGWLLRTKGPGQFGRETVALFPQLLEADHDYPAAGDLPAPPNALHSICTTLHQTGINSFFCAARVNQQNITSSVQWSAVQLGLPVQPAYRPLEDCIASLHFVGRGRRFNFLRNHADVTAIPDEAAAEEFSKEHLRVSVQTRFMAELSDIDGVFFGRQFTYPIEIKEKTPAPSADMGPFFGLDVGPFVKLAFYTAKRGNLHSLFVVREIDNAQDRNLVNWLYIPFDRLALFASWVFQPGGRAMGGGASSVVRVPRSEFQILDAGALAAL